MYRTDLLLVVEKSLILGGLALGFSLLAFIVLAACAASGSSVGNERLASATGAAFVFALLGIVIGMTIGSSRVPVVEQVLPAALTFIGGIALYLISREKADPLVVSAAVTGFSLLMFAGTVLGSFERSRSARQAMVPDLRLLQHQADAEFAISAYRDALNLPPLSADADQAPQPAARPAPLAGNPPTPVLP